MSRTARVVLPGMPHHVTQRGNNQQDVFFADDDRRAYLAFLKDQTQRRGLDVLGYCLMTNHVHLVAIPRDSASLARALGRVHWQYTQRMNVRQRRSGHLWHERFYSSPLEDSHTFAAMRYVERNPVRAGLVEAAWEYKWSSAAAHIGAGDATGLLDVGAWSTRCAPQEWREYLVGEEDEAVLATIRSATARGRPATSQ